MAILRRDTEAFEEAVDTRQRGPRGGPVAQAKRRRRLRHVQNLLNRAHVFRPVPAPGEPGLNAALLDVLRDLLENSPPPLPPPTPSTSRHRRPLSSPFPPSDPDPGPGPGPDPTSSGGGVLEAHCRAYRGNFVHLAAAAELPEIVAATLEAAERFESGRQGEQLTARDSEGRTALELAVLCPSGGGHTLNVVLAKLFVAEDEVKDFNAAPVIRDAVHRTTHGICKRPGIEHNVRLLLRLGRDRYGSRDVSLLWPIYLHDMDMLEMYMADRGEFDVFRPPHELHYAVRHFCGSTFSEEETRIVKYLVDCPDLLAGKRQVGVDDVCSLEVGGRVEVNGTAVHFALSSLSHEEYLVHPGYGWGPFKHGAVDPERLNPEVAPESCRWLPDDHPILPVLDALLAAQASFAKPNRFRKMPMNCLPPYVDPRLISILLSFSQVDTEEEGGGAEGAEGAEGEGAEGEEEEEEEEEKEEEETGEEEWEDDEEARQHS